MTHTDEQSPHRLFAAIVLMGTGLAVGCGGMAEGGRQVSGGGAPQDDSTTGGIRTGATTPSGGTGVGAATSTGGTSNIGNPPMLNTGGVTPAPEAVEPGPFKCPPEQWSCVSTQCDYSSPGWKLPDESCGCDLSRPLGPSDCEPGQVFVCQHVTSTADGRPLTKPVALSCTCVQKTMYFCSSECDGVYSDQEHLTCIGSEDELSALCGCAVVYLK